MLHDVDETLKALLVQRMPIDPTAIDVRFEAPTRDWATGVTRPTINLFLYDIRENHELRGNERARVPIGAGMGEAPPPVRVDLRYLISAWATEISDEHQLLGSVLTTLLRFPVLPADVLRGSMIAQPIASRVWIGQGELTPNPWDFWGNVEHRMKAGLSFVVTTALQTLPPQPFEVTTQTVVNIATRSS